MTSQRKAALVEPETMAQVQALVETAYPGKPYNVWIAPRSHPFRRHISVKFGGDTGTIEAYGSTWLEALADIGVMRAVVRRRSRAASKRRVAP